MKVRIFMSDSHFIERLNTSFMNFFKKLFGSTDKIRALKPENKNPDNTKLTYLLDIYGQDPSNENYKAVLNEITTGNSFLLLPSANKNNGFKEWETTQVDTTINLASIFNFDGLKVLGHLVMKPLYLSGQIVKLNTQLLKPGI